MEKKSVKKSPVKPKEKPEKVTVEQPEQPAQEIKEQKPATKGVLLVAYGDKSYGGWAYNMAQSLRYHSPSVNIHLACMPETVKDIDLSVFTTVDMAPDLPFKFNGTIDTAQAKTLLFDLSPYDQTIYLDVDGVALNDIEPYFERVFAGHSVYYQGMGQGTKADAISYMWLLSNEITWNHFGLKEDAIFTTSQTSFVAFDRSELADKFFARLKENYKNKAADNLFAITWGPAAHQPDELYYSGTAAQLGIIPDMAIQPVMFPREHVGPQNIGKEVVDKFLILSMWGARNLVRPWAKDYYNRLMHKYLSSFFTPHIFKAHQLYDKKFSGRK